MSTTMTTMIEEVKFSAEKSMKEEKYAEAFFYWTKAIHLAEQKGTVETKMYCQRAKCFMQTEQFHFALEDAKKVLEMDPTNALGHLR